LNNVSLLPDDLGPSAPGYGALALKASLGAMPFAGSLLVELVVAAIPKQRSDRIADFAKKLERQIQEADLGRSRAWMHPH
jgi:hypothetical protein